MEATFSVRLCICAQGKAARQRASILGTCRKRQLRWSRSAPFRSAFKPDTPWQGGPAPSRTNPTPLNRSAQPVTISAVTSSTSCTSKVSGKFASTTRWANGLHSMDTCPATGAPNTSIATLSAPIPSNRPIESTWQKSWGSGMSPRTWLTEAANP